MDVHDETGGRLRTLLDDAGTPALPEGLVDDALAAGGRLRRLRVLRRTAAGSLCAAAVVAGAWTGVPALVGAGPPARTLPGGTATDPTSVASPPDAREVDLRAAADLFPADDELGGDLRYVAGLPLVDVAQPVVDGAQACDVAGREASGAAAVPLQVASNVAARGGVVDAGRPEVSITVSRWRDDRGWQQLVADEGHCAWRGVEVATWPGGDAADRLWLTDPTDAGHVTAVRKVGRLVVGVDLRNFPGTTAAGDALRLSDLVAERAAANGQYWAEPTP